MSRPTRTDATNLSTTVRIIDSADGTPETGVTDASAGLDLWYRKGTAGAQSSITEADLNALTDAHSDGGLLHIAHGFYRLDLPDAAVPDSVGEATIVGGTVTDMIVLGVELVGVTDLNSSEIETDTETGATTAIQNNKLHWLLNTDASASSPVSGSMFDDLFTLVSSAWTLSTGTLARFADADSGETTAVSGSVAKLAQASTVSLSGSATYSGPVNASTNEVNIVAGDDYHNDDSAALSWTSSDWADLTSGTLTCVVEHGSSDGTSFTPTPSIVTSGSGSQTIRIELTDTQTSALSEGSHHFRIRATLSGGNKRTLVDSTWTTAKEIT